MREVEKDVDTVVALGVGTRCDENGEEQLVAPILERLGYKLERAKTNMGLGRITNPVENKRRRAAQRSSERNPMTNTLHRYGDAESFATTTSCSLLPAAARTTSIACPS